MKKAIITLLFISVNAIMFSQTIKRADIITANDILKVGDQTITEDSLKALADTNEVSQIVEDSLINVVKYVDTTSIVATKYDLDQLSTIGADVGDSSYVTLTADTVKTTIITGNNLFLNLGTTQKEGAFDKGAVDPVHAERMNYDGNFYSTRIRAKTNLDTAIIGIAPMSDGPVGVYGFGGVGILGESSFGIAGYFHKSSVQSGNDANHLMQLVRIPSGTGNTTGDILKITDNPTTSGTKSGKVLSAVIGTTERVSLNPRATTSSNYWFDTHAERGNNTVFAIGNSEDSILRVGNFGVKFQDNTFLSHGATWFPSSGQYSVLADSGHITFAPVAKFDTSDLTVRSLTVTDSLISQGKIEYENTFWDDLSFQGSQLSRTGVVSKPDYDTANIGLLFPQNDTTERVGTSVQMRHEWKEGTSIYPHVHYIQTTADTPDFRIKYRVYNRGAAVPSTYTIIETTYHVYQWTSGSGIHNIAEFPAINMSGKTFSCQIDIILYRKDSQVTGDVLMKFFDIHYEIDSPGSGSQSNKW